MHPEKLKALAAKLDEVAASAGPPLQEYTESRRWMFGPRLAFSLVDTHIERYDDVVRGLLSERDWTAKFSERFVRQSLRPVLVQLVELGDKRSIEEAQRLLGELVQKLEQYAHTERTVYVPLIGVLMQQDTLPIGRVTLRRVTADYFKKLSQSMARTSSDQGDDTDTNDDLLEFAEWFLEPLKDKVCAEHRCVAEQDRAQERALEETRRAVELLRYCIPAVCGVGTGANVGIEGELPPPSYRTVIVVPFVGEGISQQAEASGADKPLRIDARAVDVMRRIGLFQVSDILRKPPDKLNDLEESVLRAIHHFAAAAVEPEYEGALLRFVMSLEAILTPEDREPVRDAISRRAALVASAEVEQRMTVKRIVQRCYDKRSRISHGGQKVVLASEVAELASVAYAVTKWVIDNPEGFASRNDMGAWLERKELS